MPRHELIRAWREFRWLPRRPGRGIIPGIGTPSRIRTRGLLIRSQALYPLSYGGKYLEQYSTVTRL